MRAPRPIVLQAERIAEVELVGVRAGWVRVEVVDRGVALEGARVSIAYEGAYADAFEHRARALPRGPGVVSSVDPPGTANEAFTDARGVHTFRPLPPGRDVISVDGDRVREIHLLEGDSIHATVEVKQGP